MKERFKKIGKDSLIYGIGGVIGKIIGFFLLPIYTRIFSPTDYGIIDLLTVIETYFMAIMDMGTISSQSYYFFEQKQEGPRAQAQIVSSIFQWRIFSGLLLLALALLMTPFFNRAFFQGKLSWRIFFITFLGGIFTQHMSQSAEVFRLLYRPWSYVALISSKGIVAACSVIFLVIIFKWGIFGYFAGYCLGTLIIGIIGWFKLLQYQYIDWSVCHYQWWPKLLKFGLPLLPATLAIDLLVSSDRFFINYFHGYEALGLYAVGAKFALLTSLAAFSFRQAWWPIALDSMQTDEGPHLFRIMSRFYLGCGSALVVILTAFSPLLIRWFTGPAFHNAYPIVGVLAWYSIFYGFYLICAGGLWKTKKTIWIPLLMAITAFINIILDFFLVPRYGCMGAAVATSFSFLLLDIMTILLSEFLWPVNHQFGVLGLQVLIGTLATTIIVRLYSQNYSLIPIIVITFIAVSILLSISARPNHFRLAYFYSTKYLKKRYGKDS